MQAFKIPQLGPKSDDKCLYKTRRNKETWGEDDQVTTEAEIGETQL